MRRHLGVNILGGVSFGRAALLGGCNRIWETGDITVFSMKSGDGVELNLLILKQTRIFFTTCKKNCVEN